MKRVDALLLVVTSALLACQITNLFTSLSPTPTPTARARPTATAPIAQAVAPPTELPAAPPTEPPQPVPATITGDNLRVRAQPNTNAAIVARLNKGDAVQVTGRTAANDWLQIFQIQKPEVRGWISAQYAQVNGSLDTIPVLQPGQSSAPPASPPPQPPSQPYPPPQPPQPPTPRAYP